jgi:hypothetical protein
MAVCRTGVGGQVLLNGPLGLGKLSLLDKRSGLAECRILIRVARLNCPQIGR